jgi:hypothetical protein
VSVSVKYKVMLDVGSSERELLDVSKMVVLVELSVEAGMGVSGQA